MNPNPRSAAPWKRSPLSVLAKFLFLRRPGDIPSNFHSASICLPEPALFLLPPGHFRFGMSETRRNLSWLPWPLTPPSEALPNEHLMKNLRGKSEGTDDISQTLIYSSTSVLCSSPLCVCPTLPCLSIQKKQKNAAALFLPLSGCTHLFESLFLSFQATCGSVAF